MVDVLVDALVDSSIIFGVVLVINFIVSFIEGKLSNKLAKRNRISPLIGASIGLIPQCGFSIVAADMYEKKHISMGTLIAVFIACSDEALPIMFSDPKQIKMILPLLSIKLVVGFLIGFLVDFSINLITKKKQVLVEEINPNEIHKGCCHHDIEEHQESNDQKHPFIHEHIIHPLIHSLKIFAYVLVINILFGFIVYFVGEDVISDFLISNQYLTPLLSVLVGLIPNCASSVIITKLFLKGSISFGATVGGLICNAGLGLIFLLKNKKNWKNSLIIISILIATALSTGYITLLIENLI